MDGFADSMILQLVFQWLAPWLALAAAWIATGLTIAVGLQSFATGVLRPIAKLTPGKRDDRYVELSIWWLDGAGDVLKEWSFARWVPGLERARRMLEDREKPLAKRRRD